jgi:hypothetical protein
MSFEGKVTFLEAVFFFFCILNHFCFRFDVFEYIYYIITSSSLYSILILRS